MKIEKPNKTCKSIRDWLHKAVSSHIGFDTNWVQNHIAHCPKCQRRLVSLGKVSLALSIIKSQPHNLDLLMRANAQAIKVLKHGLRDTAKAQKLKAILPEPGLLERCDKYKHSAANAAACLAILFLLKIGIFSSVDKVQSDSQKFIKQYCASQLGDELTDEIFPV